MTKHFQKGFLSFQNISVKEINFKVLYITYEKKLPSFIEKTKEVISK